MKQLDLFPDTSKPQDMQVPRAGDTWQVYVDGAARNNPGPAGIGIYITCNGERVISEGFFLGSKTNNQAEYAALIVGLLFLMELIKLGDRVEIISDSELLVKQVQGLYKVRQPELQKLHRQAVQLLQPLHYIIRHVLRKDNAVADELANRGIDTKNPLPEIVAKKVTL